MIYLIKKRFDPENYIFIEAYDGEETLTRVRDERPDLILLDLKMPRKNGMEVLEEIKEDFELKDIPVIVLTVVSDEKEKIRALEIGANDFLVKPPEAAELRARVHTQLEILKATNIFKKYSLHLEGMVSRKLRELKEYANRLEEMVDEKVGVIRKQNEDLLFSLKAAKKVQKSLLPPESISIEEAQAVLNADKGNQLNEVTRLILENTSEDRLSSKKDTVKPLFYFSLFVQLIKPCQLFIIQSASALEDISLQVSLHQHVHIIVCRYPDLNGFADYGWIFKHHFSQLECRPWTYQLIKGSLVTATFNVGKHFS